MGRTMLKTGYILDRKISFRVCWLYDIIKRNESLGANKREEVYMLDILIVEDNKEIAALLCDFLRKENYVVSVADTGEKAIDIYEKYGAKLIILDIMLPGMDGFAVCSKIRDSSTWHP